MRVKITVTKNLLPSIAAQLPAAALEIVQQVGTGILSQTVAATHIDSGDMARAWQFTAARTATGAYGEITNNVEYAPYEEFGTGAEGQSYQFPGKPDDLQYTQSWKGRPGHPALTPAVEAGRREWDTEWGSLRRRLRR